ncbi:MAG: hypothetical protein M3M98_03090 [Nitrospirota bacterium]|nr:hypothetical protein [Nitrospirota bacterium]
MEHLTEGIRRRRMVASLLVCLFLMVGTTRTLLADDLQPDVNAADAIRQTLDQQVGKRATVKLHSGHELDGKVLKVGSAGVPLAELTGMELFDAVIRLESIDAVIIRART